MMWRGGGGGGGGGAPATGGVQDFLAIELWTMGGRHRELPFLHLCPQGQIQGMGEGGGGAEPSPFKFGKNVIFIKVVVYSV